MPMNIVYNNDKNQWQCDSTERFKLGKNHLPVTRSAQPSGYHFHVRKVNDKLGPVVGVLVSKETRDDFYGNRGTFKRIQKYLLKHGGISFVLTPEGLGEDSAEGYVFIDGEWKKLIFPLPDIIYNRIASYKTEKSKAVMDVQRFAMKKGIPFYNPHFFEKWETYLLLANNELLNKVLPNTEVLSEKTQLFRWLQTCSSFFVKATLSNRGDGVIVLTNDKGSLLLKTNKSEERYDNLDDLWRGMKSIFPHQKLILQEKVYLQQFDDRPFDFRVLVQRVRDNWDITGIGVRCAGKNSITTHVPQGGEILSLETVQHLVDFDYIGKIAQSIAFELEKAYGYLCEFSIDLGIDIYGSLWIFEVNSKPMKFDELNIQEKALERLVQCFYYDSGFD